MSGDIKVHIVRGTPLGKFRSLIGFIRDRPDMYLGKKSITALHLFVTGILCWENCVGSGKPVEDDLFSLQLHVVRKLRRKNGATPAALLALQKAKGDEEAGFDLWYKWWDSYLKEETKK